MIAAPQPDINQFVNKTGDTMTGQLLIKYGAAAFQLNKSIDGAPAGIYGYSKDKARWVIRICDGALETGGNTGENFAISRYADDGSSYLGPALTISRATGVADFAQKPTVAGAAWAAPLDALAYSGMQINGSMEVSQERGTSGTNTNGSFVCDGWSINWAGTMALGAWGGPLAFIYGIGGLLYTQVNTAQASLGANDYAMVRQAIEGYRVSRLAWGTAGAMPITIGFWSAHSKAGIFGGSVRNGAGNRYYAFNYTHNVSDVSQYNTVTIPGDTAGTWAVDNSVGMYLTFAIAAGSTLTAPVANVWAAGAAISGPGQINGVNSTTSSVFRITGVVVLPGIEAPSAARSPLIMRPYDQELVTCRRHWRSIGGTANADYMNGLTGTTTHGAFVQYLDTPMRASPVCNLVNLTAFSVSTATGMGAVSSFVPATNPISVRIDATCAPHGAGAGVACFLRATTATALVTLDARI